MNLAGAAPGADLGGSSKYSRETPGGPMWRRVPCEQLLNTGQSILRLRGSLDQTCGVSLTSRATVTPKGNLVHIPEPGSGTVSDPRSVVATRRDRETPARALGRVVFSA